MNAPAATLAEPASLDEAVASACARIAPSWPLDRQIAVNPLWGYIDSPFDQAADALWQRAGASMYMPLAYYAEAWREGRIELADLRAACAALDPLTTPTQMLAALDAAPAQPQPLMLLSELADTRRDLRHEPDYANVVRSEVGDFCAAYFDDKEAGWKLGGSDSLYSAWLAYMRVDSGLGRLLDLPRLRERVRRLPGDAAGSLRFVAAELGIPSDRAAELFETLLRRVNGWASWCAYRCRQAATEGRDDQSLSELLAIRLAWEWLLDDGRRDPASVWAEWQAAWQRIRRGVPPVYGAWQSALEIAGQRELIAPLAARDIAAQPAAPRVQAVFCIDVRSEPLRRKLEQEMPAIQTLGFAGFFGLPIALQPLGGACSEPRLPGPLDPVHRALESSGDATRDVRLAERRRRRLALGRHWQRLSKLPLSGFSQVELFGLGYVLNLLRRSLRWGAPDDPLASAGWRPAERAALRPRLALEPGSTDAIELAAGILRAMSLTENFARLVVLVGHGSNSSNNPHAAGLDCGACGGHSGLPNARLLADLLNTPALRAGLAERGIRIPDSTRFIAGMHDTTRETLRFIADHDLPDEQRPLLEELQHAAERAAAGVRAERARSLGLDRPGRDPRRLAAAFDRRARDWAQTRPEWGLAGNAAFVAAPRERTRGLDLQGQVFLHEYQPGQDPEGSVLQQIMTAPLVVAHWINLQYYASTTANQLFGSGNKLLHNVVGGGIGVFEGNGGDLRVGLPMQSLHDGRRWVHSPRRLTAVIEAPRERIEAVLDAHADVRNLVVNEWVLLIRLDSDSQRLESYRAGVWRDVFEELH